MHIEKDRQFVVNQMVREISSILSDCGPSIYMYGSSVLNDFRLGWSDIDILVLTDRQISEEQAKTLVGLRQAMLTREPATPITVPSRAGCSPCMGSSPGKRTVSYIGAPVERE